MLTVYMDLDDTLIQTNQLFESYKRKCAKYIQNVAKHRGLYLSKEEILHEFVRIEAKNLPLLGLRNTRFIRSWAETYHLFLPEGFDPSEIMALANEVFYTLSPLMEGALEQLNELIACGYKITIITSGQTDVQNRRIDQVGLRPYFHEFIVVPEKTVEVMTELVPDPLNSVMIGNSVTSDVNPALAIGMKAIQIEAPSWFYDESPLLEDAKRHPESMYACTILPHLTKTLMQMEAQIQQSAVSV